MVLKIQQLTGLLNFICRVVVPGRAFTRRFYAKIANPKLKQNHHINVDNEMRHNCLTWLEFLNSDRAMCRLFLDLNSVLQADMIDFTLMPQGLQTWVSDVCSARGGCLVNGCCLYGITETEHRIP